MNHFGQLVQYCNRQRRRKYTGSTQLKSSGQSLVKCIEHNLTHRFLLKYDGDAEHRVAGTRLRQAVSMFHIATGEAVRLN